MVTVSAGARLHVGFQNLSLAHDRLYGGIGIGLDEPRVRVEARRAEAVSAPDDVTRRYAKRAMSVLSVPGVAVEAVDPLPRHVGLGSGTQLALAIYVATARAYELEPTVRAHAPDLGRGGRSGVGVATFESGGFVVDGGHPSTRFTTAPPEPGEWEVPPTISQLPLPDSWRFLVILPDADPGRSGEGEDASIRTVVEDAEPAIADDIAGVLTRRLLPAAANGRLDAFGEAIERIGRLNGRWYADVQGGVYRPPAGRLVDALESVPVLSGLGQSSWGPAVYGVTDETHAREAESAARRILESLGCSGSVLICAPARTGATVDD
ncbi:beta-ribofuranosylaminobenzene 5'-phosphate synthase family protein [Halovivax gelatinilyticus]|uniref:beta-ribofuranosylaminobenzene 5'-phosphate synthase family protein n=1 Tax=Halovivax gelatinilyticus TaxID=2961597 RepID=UPI0020CA891E|nr:beta-ribofuranosylaminobenzene 5'-phosphate synthase family protein [Halovivax gelatinilyticus]